MNAGRDAYYTFGPRRGKNGSPGVAFCLEAGGGAAKIRAAGAFHVGGAVWSCAVNRRCLLNCLWLAAACLLTGCAPPSLEARLSSEDPKVRVGAAVELAGGGPAGAQPADAHRLTPADVDAKLIHLLADEDEGVRFYAAAALYRRTGQRFDFQPQGSLRERAESIRRWIDWHATKYPGSARAKPGYAEAQPGGQGKFDDLQARLKAVLGEGGSAPAESGKPAVTDGAGKT